MLYSLASFVLGIFIRLFFKVEIVGNNIIPKDKAYIIASNHTSNMDVVMVMGTVKNRKIHFLAKKELFKNRVMAHLLKKAYVISIDRDKNDLKALKQCMKVLKNGKVLGIFPQGTRVKGQEDIEAKLGIGMFAVTTNTPVIPVSIKAHELYKPFSKVTITYHAPYQIPRQISENKDKSKRNENFKQVADEVMDIINSRA